MYLEEWTNEDLGLKVLFEGEMIHQEQSQYQDIIVFDTKAFGRILMLDGAIQLSESDEKIYHSTMVDPIIDSTHKNVLIIGGGDGGILRELVKYDFIEKITMVEIDQRVVDVSKEYLPFVSNGSLDDSRLNLIIQDAKIFLRETDEKFDLVIVDSTDPNEKDMTLFSEMFYRSIQNTMNEHGTVICQIPTLAKDTVSYVVKTYKELFPSNGYHFVSVPSFTFGNVMMVWGKKSEYF